MSSILVSTPFKSMLKFIYDLFLFALGVNTKTPIACQLRGFALGIKKAALINKRLIRSWLAGAVFVALSIG